MFLKWTNIICLQDSPLFARDASQPAMLFTCQTGTGRVNVGAVMGYLLLTYKDRQQKLKK